MAGELLRCLVVLLVILPGLLLIGPLLLVTACRGSQRFGPLVFNVRRSGWKGRLTSGLIGITLWAVVWGGLVWWSWPVVESLRLSRAIEGISSLALSFPHSGADENAQRATTASFPMTVSATALPTIVPGLSPQLPTRSVERSLLTHTAIPFPVGGTIHTATPTSVLSITLTRSVAANTRLPHTTEPSPALSSTEEPTDNFTPMLSPTPTATPTETPSPTPTMTPTRPPSPTPTATPTSTPTETPTLTMTPTPIPLPTPSHTPTPSPSPTVTATPTVDPARQAIAAVERANEALRLALEMPSPERLKALATYWQDRAFPNVRAFVFAMIKLVGRPVRASYVYLIPPLATYDRLNGVAHVNAIEIWTYEGSAITYQEQFAFHYVLAQREADWVIVDYTYRNVPTATPP